MELLTCKSFSKRSIIFYMCQRLLRFPYCMIVKLIIGTISQNHSNLVHPPQSQFQKTAEEHFQMQAFLAPRSISEFCLRKRVYTSFNPFRNHKLSSSDDHLVVNVSSCRTYNMSQCQLSKTFSFLRQLTRPFPFPLWVGKILMTRFVHACITA